MNYDQWKCTDPAEREIDEIEPARMGYAELYAAVRSFLPDQTFIIGVSTQHQVYRHPGAPPCDITRWTVTFAFDNDKCQLVQADSADELFGKLRAALVPVDPIAAVGDISW